VKHVVIFSLSMFSVINMVAQLDPNVFGTPKTKDVEKYHEQEMNKACKYLQSTGELRTLPKSTQQECNRRLREQNKKNNNK
jgi:hypothetical protein